MSFQSEAEKNWGKDEASLTLKSYFNDVQDEGWSNAVAALTRRSKHIKTFLDADQWKDYVSVLAENGFQLNLD